MGVGAGSPAVLDPVKYGVDDVGGIADRAGFHGRSVAQLFYQVECSC